VTPATLDALQDAAEAEGVSMSDIIRDALEVYLFKQQPTAQKEA
jgi:hypothetical protein